MKIVLETIIEQFLAVNEIHHTSLTPLQHDASSRRYYRITTATKSLIVCYDETLQTISLKNYPFYITHRLLKNYTISIPEVYVYDSEKGLIMQDDLGDILLSDHSLKSDKDKLKKFYTQAIDTMITLQSIPNNGSLPFQLAFDQEKLMFEFDFFIEHALLGYFTASPDASEIQCIKNEFIKIASILAKQEYFVFTHRDYHSRNLMVYDDTLYVIDFQDARMGLPQYDLVSLLRDPYSQLEESLYIELCNYYYTVSFEKGIHSFSRDEFDYYYNIMAFQRLIKAIGTYGYQSMVKKSDRYRESITVALEYLTHLQEKHEAEALWKIIASHLKT